MNASDIIAWTLDGAAYCDDCEPSRSARGDHPAPVFADAEEGVIGWTCDACQACYVAGAGWLSHDEATGRFVYWTRCEACESMRPTVEGVVVERCANCRRGRCLTPDGAKRDAIVAEVVTPNGYPLLARCVDGQYLCAKCCAAERDRLAAPDPDPDWRVVAASVHWEGPPEPCAHCGNLTASAYGDPDGDGPMVPTGGAS